MKKDLYDYSKVSSNYSLLRTVQQVGARNVSQSRIDKINDTFSTHDLYLAEKYLHKIYAKRSRLRKKISKMLSFDDCVFITLTIDNKSMKKDKDLLFLYAKRFLKANYNWYILNEDYGSQTDRYHFHAIACLVKTLSFWDYGFYSVDRIYSKNKYALTLYLDKFINHITKDTACRTCHSKNPNFGAFFDLPHYDPINLDEYISWVNFVDCCKHPCKIDLSFLKNVPPSTNL